MGSGIKLRLSDLMVSPHWFPNNFCVILFSSFIVLIPLSSLGSLTALDGMCLLWAQSLSCLGRVGTTVEVHICISTLCHALQSQCLSEAEGLLWAAARWCHDSLPHSSNLLTLSFCKSPRWTQRMGFCTNRGSCPWALRECNWISNEPLNVCTPSSWYVWQFDLELSRL